MFTQYALKSGWEIVATPLTYRVVAFLKRAESEDYYDIGTNFTPFSLQASRVKSRGTSNRGRTANSPPLRHNSPSAVKPQARMLA
jgi:hypothetical protein